MPETQNFDAGTTCFSVCFVSRLADRPGHCIVVLWVSVHPVCVSVHPLHLVFERRTQKTNNFNFGSPAHPFADKIDFDFQGNILGRL